MDSTWQPAVLKLADGTFTKLREDGEFILYRGRCRNSINAVPQPTLVVAPLREHTAPRSLRRMEHEYSLRAELDPAWAVRPLALAGHQGRTVLVFEDPGGEPLDQLVGTPMELRQFLRLAIGLSAALGRLHQHGLIHKDIKPANALVNAATGQVWLMGFGIASRLPRERQAPEPPDVLAGALAYMAPEQTGRMTRAYERRPLLLRAYVSDFVEQNNSTTYGESVAAMAFFYHNLTDGPMRIGSRITARDG